MQRLYGCVPLLNVVGSLMFLLIVSLQPATTSLGVDFYWQGTNLLATAAMIIITIATAFAHQRRTKQWGLLINGIIVVAMALGLWHAQVPDAISDYLWLWALLMIFNLALIGWGWGKLRPKTK
ncbi:hypothetical protein [Levilactobacillus yiduensis]|uniref:hypothetical protein n=1 Tax=Levilactobacillus yiduensis TaxID=2953880 RepID=UPI000EF34F0A|nr:hypothetical protein [Levilactobacillus yiduensis]AYM02371.1 hypothetical protein D8911_04930 [Levilactobacillus brevis]